MSHIQVLSYYIDSIFQALEDQEDSTRKPTINELAVDGEIAVVGGSDTTTTTLSCLLLSSDKPGILRSTEEGNEPNVPSR